MIRAAHEFEVTDEALGGTVTVRGFVAEPAVPAPDARLVYCLAGGHCTTGYFDLEVDGDRSYSLAEALTAAGHWVASFDHPGIGTSDPLADLFLVTLGVAAAAHARVVEQLPGPTRRIGLGHSMGGALLDAVQARHRPFDAIVGLGHSGNGLPNVLTADELAFAESGADSEDARLVTLARHRFAPAADAVPVPRSSAPGRFHADDVDPAAIAAFGTQTTRLLVTCGLSSMIPGLTDADKAVIDVPVLLALGDQDLVTDLPGTAARYRAATDLTLVTLPHTGHCHHTASSRAALFGRIIAWIAALDAAVGPSTKAVPA